MTMKTFSKYVKLRLILQFCASFSNKRMSVCVIFRENSQENQQDVLNLPENDRFFEQALHREGLSELSGPPRLLGDLWRVHRVASAGARGLHGLHWRGPVAAASELRREGVDSAAEGLELLRRGQERE